jgi:uncharacterized protein YunC (DUF1805 family)
MGYNLRPNKNREPHMSDLHSESASKSKRSSLIVFFSVTSFTGVAFVLLFGSLYDEPWMLEHRVLFARTFLAITLVTSVLGVSGFVMGFRDLRKMKSGKLVDAEKKSTVIGIVLGVVGPILSLLVMISFLSVSSVRPFENALQENIMDIATDAYEYRVRLSASAESKGSYTGYILPDKLKIKYNSRFEVTVLHPDSILIVGYSGYVEGSVTSVLGPEGRLHHWTSTGDFY